MGQNNVSANMAYNEGFIAIGWNEIAKDPREYQKIDKGEFVRQLNPLMEKVFPNHSKGSRGQSLEQLSTLQLLFF